MSSIASATRVVKYIKKGNDGDDAITFSVSGENVVFLPNSLQENITIYAYKGGKQITLSEEWIPNIGLDNCSIDCGENADGSVCYVLTRKSTDVVVSGSVQYYINIDGVKYYRTITVRTLTGAITFNITGENVVFTKDTNTCGIMIEAYCGGTRITAANIAVTMGTSDLFTSKKVTYGFGVKDDNMTMYFTRADTSEDISGSVSYVITIDNVDYTRMITFSTLESPVTYSIVLSSSNIDYYPNRDGYAPGSITAFAYKTEGDTTVEFASYIKISFTYKTGVVSSADSDGDTSNFTKTLVSTTANGCIKSVTAYLYDEDEKEILAQVTVQVTSHATPRGPQNWEDCAVGYDFQSGDAGETYIDTVIYGGLYYVCMTSHTKTASNYPTSNQDTAQTLWSGTSKQDLVATMLLLADLAKIANLYVDDIFMVTNDDTTAIWINPANGGMKIVKRSALNSTERSEQANETAWSNPTAYFHAGDIPNTEDIFGSNTPTTTSKAVSQSYISSSDIDSPSIDTGSDDYTISLTTSGAVQVTVTGCEVTLDESEDYDSSEGSGQSTCDVELGYYVGTTWTTIKRVTLVASNSTDTVDVGSASFTYAATSSTTLKIGMRLTWALRYQGKVEMNGTMTISYRTVNYGYVSQYGGNGTFVGISSQDFFRMAISGNNMEYALLCNDSGLKINTNGMFQRITGIDIPVGATLLWGWINGGSTNIQTFDNSIPTIQRTGAGLFVFYLSAEWVSRFGVLSKGNTCVTVTPFGDKCQASVIEHAANSVNRGKIEIKTYNASGTFTEIPFWIRIDYMGAAQTVIADEV